MIKRKEGLNDRAGEEPVTAAASVNNTCFLNMDMNKIGQFLNGLHATIDACIKYYTEVPPSGNMASSVVPMVIINKTVMDMFESSSRSVCVQLIQYVLENNPESWDRELADIELLVEMNPSIMDSISSSAPTDHVHLLKKIVDLDISASQVTLSRIALFLYCIMKCGAMTYMDDGAQVRLFPSRVIDFAGAIYEDLRPAIKSCKFPLPNVPRAQHRLLSLIKCCRWNAGNTLQALADEFKIITTLIDEHNPVDTTAGREHFVAELEKMKEEDMRNLITNEQISFEPPLDNEKRTTIVREMLMKWDTDHFDEIEAVE